MKKSLLKVAASIVGLLGCNAAMAYDTVVPNEPVKPVNEGLYYIFDAHAVNDATTDNQAGGDNCRYAFRYDDNGTIKGTHDKAWGVASGRTTLTNAHVWKVTTADGGTTWSFQNMGTKQWIKGAQCATSATESEKGLFDIEGDNVNAFTVRVNGTTNNRWDGNGGGVYPMVYWGGSGHPIRFYEAVADGDGYKIASNNAWNVTYTFTTPDGQTFTRTASVADGADAAAHIPTTVDYFTATGLQETETTVGENAKAFNVTGTWNYPIKANTVYRIRIRPDDGPNYVAANADGSAIQTSSSATGTELEKTILWYFKSVGYDAEGHPTFTMHSLSDMTKGVTFQNNNDGKASSLGETPTQLTAVPSTGENFAFKFTIDGTEHFVNRRVTNFSSWTAADGAYASETGCQIRATSLTDDDFAALAISATEDEINAAKANPTPEAISALIDKYQASPLAQAIAALTRAIDATEEYNGFIGTGLGQYNNAAGDFADKLAEAKALLNNPDATKDEINAAAEAIAVSNLSINQPKAGHFYRFHYGDDYLSSTLASNGRFSIEKQSNADALNNTTVFYFDGTYLVTYPDGLVMGNMQTTPNTLHGVLVTANEAGKITFLGSRFEKGKYNIHSAENDRYLYHQETFADAGNSAAVSSNSAGYRWEISEVTWLPTPYSGNGYLSICAPVDLDFSTWPHATPYIGVLQGENVGKKATDAIVPANTPVILDVKDSQYGCVYVHVSYSETSAQAADDTNSLATAGNYAGTAKEEGQSYFTVNGDSFAAHTGDTLPAFAAVLKVPTEQAKAEGYAITDFDPDYVSITEIEGAANNGKQVIYDLQGRRVQRASKGLYIINGVKTLVK